MPTERYYYEICCPTWEDWLKQTGCVPHLFDGYLAACDDEYSNYYDDKETVRLDKKVHFCPFCGFNVIKTVVNGL